jgi:DNA-binding XRE family transcriptional regulator
MSQPVVSVDGHGRGGTMKDMTPMAEMTPVAGDRPFTRIEPERFARLPPAYQKRYALYEDWVGAIGEGNLRRIEELRDALEAPDDTDEDGYRRENVAEMVQRVGQAIRFARVSAGFTLEAVSQSSGIARSQLSRIERGRSAARVDQLVKIARSLRMPFMALLEHNDIRVCLQCGIRWQSHLRVCPDSGFVPPVMKSPFRGEPARGNRDDGPGLS